MYRRLASVKRRSWLATALRRTVVPAVAMALLLAIGGRIMQTVYPDAVRLAASSITSARRSRPLGFARLPARSDSPAARVTTQRSSR